MDDAEKSVKGKHSQLFASGGIVAAILVLQPVMDIFVTRGEAKAQTEQITQLNAQLVDVKEDLTRRLERSNDKIMERLDQMETRVMKNADRVERRVERLEAGVFRTKSGS